MIKLKGSVILSGSPLVGTIFTGFTMPIAWKDNVQTYTYKSSEYNLYIDGLSSVGTIIGNNSKEVIFSNTSSSSTTDSITYFTITATKGSQQYVFEGRYFYYGTAIESNRVITIASEFAPEPGTAGNFTDNWTILESSSLPTFATSTTTYLGKYSHQIVSFNFGTTTITTLTNSFLNFVYNFNQPIIIPEGVTSIGNSFLNSANSFNQPINMPNSVTSIGSGFLSLASGFNQPLTMPNNLTIINVSFLSSATSFNQPLNIPNSVTTINGSFLNNASSFNQPFNIPTGITVLTSGFLRGASAFNQPLIIPSNITIIGNTVFSGIGNAGGVNITTITIPSTVTTIGTEFLYNCFSLTHLIYNSSAVPAASNTTLSQTVNSKTSSTGTGIKVTGTEASIIFTNFPDRTVTAFRKLVS
jgi:hypothetical protein